MVGAAAPGLVPETVLCAPPGEAVTACDVDVVPAGADQETFADALAAAALTLVGGPGGTAGMMGALADDAGLEPTVFEAVTVNV